MPKYEIRKINKMVTVVDVHLAKGEKGFEVYSCPDAHWDNPKCDRELLKEHLDYAKKINAVIIMPGDTFCMMQGKYDKRASKSDIRPEHNKANYLDAVVNDAAAWFKPYAQNMILGQGNHETAILKNHETNVLERFAGAMGGHVPVMGYHGWVVFRLWQGKQHRATQKYYFHHGYGGGGPVTRGAINMSRYMMHVEGADIISTGHIHERNTGEVIVHYFDGQNNAYTAKARSVLLIQSSTYKQEYVDGGFHIEKGRPPKPLGGTFITFHFTRLPYENIVVKEPRFFSTKTFSI